MGQYKGFTEVELRRPKRSMFDLSHESRVSTRMGKITPILCMETLPNDTFNVSSEVFIKMAPMIAPIFHRMNLYVHYFFVPNRLLWEDWEEFITGGRLGFEVPPIPPHVTIASVLAAGVDRLDTGSLFDYLGGGSIPDSAAGTYVGGQTLDLMPFLAYGQVWMDYYRDRNYVSDTIFANVLPLASGVHAFGTVSGYMLTQQRAWQHDYFTSAQQTTQRGAEVLLPLAGTGHIINSFPPGTPLTAGNALVDVGTPPGYLTDSMGVIIEFNLDSSEVSMNEFRMSVSLQQWLERNQLAGSRYNESIKAHFGRTTSDGRLQRAEYLGGGKAVIKIDEVMTTSYSEDADANVVPPANPTGKGQAYANTNRFHYNCEEHGFVLGVLSVMPSTAYMQGTPRMFGGRHTFLDYPFPSFANLGEQPVFDYEVFTDANTLLFNQPGASEAPEAFGYQSRYAEWKHMNSTAHGDFRTSLEHWHLVRKFASEPVLGRTFVEFQDAEQDRIFNVTGVDTLWMYIYNSVRVVRSLPYFGVPAGLYPGSV